MPCRCLVASSWRLPMSHVFGRRWAGPAARLPPPPWQGYYPKQLYPTAPLFPRGAGALAGAMTVFPPPSVLETLRRPEGNCLRRLQQQYANMVPACYRWPGSGRQHWPRSGEARRRVQRQLPQRLPGEASPTAGVVTEVPRHGMWLASSIHNR